MKLNLFSISFGRLFLPLRSVLFQRILHEYSRRWLKLCLRCMRCSRPATSKCLKIILYSSECQLDWIIKLGDRNGSGKLTYLSAVSPRRWARGGGAGLTESAPKTLQLFQHSIFIPKRIWIICGSWLICGHKHFYHYLIKTSLSCLLRTFNRSNSEAAHPPLAGRERARAGGRNELNFV